MSVNECVGQVMLTSVQYLTKASQTPLVMPGREEPHTHDENLQAEAVSPNRPPQFKTSTCGYRCGWGCCEPMGGDDDGGGYESDGTPTLVDSDDGRPELPDEVDDLPSEASSLARDDVAEPVPLVIADFEVDILLNLTLAAQAEVFFPDQSEWDQGSEDSLENHAASEAHSSAASDRRSIGSASPCGWDIGMAGMGAWNDMDRAGRILPGYFCVTPLRLSPQYEHCRGSAASHLIIQDYSMLLEAGMEEHRMRMLSHGLGLRSDEFSITDGSVSGA